MLGDEPFLEETGFAHAEVIALHQRVVVGGKILDDVGDGVLRLGHYAGLRCHALGLPLAHHLHELVSDCRAQRKLHQALIDAARFESFLHAGPVKEFLQHRIGVQELLEHLSVLRRDVVSEAQQPVIAGIAFEAFQRAAVEVPLWLLTVQRLDDLAIGAGQHIRINLLCSGGFGGPGANLFLEVAQQVALEHGRKLRHLPG